MSTVCFVDLQSLAVNVLLDHTADVSVHRTRLADLDSLFKSSVGVFHLEKKFRSFISYQPTTCEVGW